MLDVLKVHKYLSIFEMFRKFQGKCGITYFEEYAVQAFAFFKAPLKNSSN